MHLWYFQSWARNFCWSFEITRNSFGCAIQLTPERQKVSFFSKKSWAFWRKPKRLASFGKANFVSERSKKNFWKQQFFKNFSSTEVFASNFRKVWLSYFFLSFLSRLVKCELIFSCQDAKKSSPSHFLSGRKKMRPKVSWYLINGREYVYLWNSLLVLTWNWSTFSTLLLCPQGLYCVSLHFFLACAKKNTYYVES